MFILHDILEKLKNEFPQSRKGQERGIWFTYTIMAIIVPFASSRTSCILRCLRSPVRLYRDTAKTILHVHGISKDTMETIVADAVENDSPTTDRRAAVAGTG